MGKKSVERSGRAPRKTSGRTPTALASLGSAKKRERQPSGSSRAPARADKQAIKYGPQGRTIELIGLFAAKTQNLPKEQWQTYAHGYVGGHAFASAAHRDFNSLSVKRTVALRNLHRITDELCNAVDNAADDIGGSRPINDILAELGPAVEAAGFALAARSGEPKAKSGVSPTERKRATKGSGRTK